MNTTLKRLTLIQTISLMLPMTGFAAEAISDPGLIDARLRSSSSPAGNSSIIKQSNDGRVVLYGTELTDNRNRQSSPSLFAAALDDGIFASTGLEILPTNARIWDVVPSDHPDQLQLVILTLEENDGDRSHVLHFYDHLATTHEDLFQQIGGYKPNGPVTRPSLSDDGRWVAFWSTASNLPVASTSLNDGYDLFVIDRNSMTLKLITEAEIPVSTEPFLPSKANVTSSSPLRIAFTHPEATSFVQEDSRPIRPTNLLVHLENSTPALFQPDFTPLFDDGNANPYEAIIEDLAVLSGDRLLLMLSAPIDQALMSVYQISGPEDHELLGISELQLGSFRTGMPLEPINYSQDKRTILADTTFHNIDAQGAFIGARESGFRGKLRPDGTSAISVTEELSESNGVEHLEVVIRQHVVESGEESELARFDDTRSHPSPSFMIDPSFSGDGRFLFFHTAARITDGDNNNEIDIFRFDLETQELLLVSVNPAPVASPYFGVQLTVPDGATLRYADSVDTPLNPLPDASIEREGDTVVDTSARNHRRRFYSAD